MTRSHEEIDALFARRRAALPTEPAPPLDEVLRLAAERRASEARVATPGRSVRSLPRSPLVAALALAAGIALALMHRPTAPESIAGNDVAGGEAIVADPVASVPVTAPVPSTSNMSSAGPGDIDANQDDESSSCGSSCGEDQSCTSGTATP